jgi:hypothetical protein
VIYDIFQPTTNVLNFLKNVYGQEWSKTMYPLDEAIAASEISFRVDNMNDEELGSHDVKRTRNPRTGMNIYSYTKAAGKEDVITRYCRGLVTDGSGNIVARAFPRFFNWGEMVQEQDLFNFNNCWAENKEDGSLIIVYNHNDEWFVNTKATFGGGLMDGPSSPTWQQMFCHILGVKNTNDIPLDKNIVYVFEMCTEYNHIVTSYETPTLYLLTAYYKYPGRVVKNGQRYLSCLLNYIEDYPDSVNIIIELPLEMRDQIAEYHGFLRPSRTIFKSIDEVIADLREKAKIHPTWEGYVICDSNNRRWKVKNPEYLLLHRLRGNPFKRPRIEDLIEVVMIGETSEFAAVFHKLKDSLDYVETAINNMCQDAWDTYRNAIITTSDRKQFAAIALKSPMSAILFKLYSLYGMAATYDQMTELLDQVVRDKIERMLGLDPEKVFAGTIFWNNDSEE